MRVGIFGSGQLGRMLALAGYPLGIKCRLYDETKGCASDVAEVVQGSFQDEAAIKKFCEECDFLTVEFENVPKFTLEIAQATGKLAPNAKVFEIASDRLFEKITFERLGIPTPKYGGLVSLEELNLVAADIGYPALLKTRSLGYDGKGQCIINGPGELLAAWKELGSVPLIMERFVPFTRELAIIGVQGAGKIRAYPLIQTVQKGGILRKTFAPAPEVSAELQGKAETYLFKLMAHFHYHGVMALEMFEKDGELLANEIAPRVHNSGHWSIEGAETSQFENHLRAVCGLPIGSTGVRGKSVSYNLLGEIPNREKLASIAGLHIHLYGKEERPGRKVGHVTLTAETDKKMQLGLLKLEELIPTK